MAARKTLAEAEAVKANIERTNPDLRLVIQDQSGIHMGKPDPRFEVVEVRTCRRCGKDFTTIAIGTYQLYDWECEQILNKENEAAAAEQRKESNRRLGQMEDIEKWEQG